MLACPAGAKSGGEEGGHSTAVLVAGESQEIDMGGIRNQPQFFRLVRCAKEKLCVLQRRVSIDRSAVLLRTNVLDLAGRDPLQCFEQRSYEWKIAVFRTGPPKSLDRHDVVAS
jgi:hypothetical protein